jgi:predicted  nucleic acid-binding Zn-ribbon protein
VNLDDVKKKQYTIAQAIKAERDKIKDELGKLNSGYVNEMGGRLTGSMEAAKSKLKKAMEDQDYDAVANAQFEIGKLSTEQSQI